MSERGCERGGDILFPENTGANRVVNVMVDVGNLIREAHNSPLIGARGAVRSVILYAVANFQGQVEPVSALFQEFDGSHTLNTVLKTARAEPVQNTFSGMPKRGVTEVMSQCDGLRECLV